MVKVTEMKLNHMDKTAMVSLFADTKGEVASAEVQGLPEGYTIDAGSSVITASGELAFMKSDGSWNWL